MVAEPGAGALQGLSSASPLFRIARPPNPWAWRSWAHVGSDGTFGNRFDDPRGVYRVLYASGARLGAFVEVLARYRPDPHIVEALRDIEGDGEAVLPASYAPGDLDVSSLAKRCVGIAQVDGCFLDVGHSRSLAVLRWALAKQLTRHGLGDLDAAAVRLSVPRRFTQEISRYAYERSTDEGTRRFAGITYRSRLGDEFRNWALFEGTDKQSPWRGEPRVETIDATDADFQCALGLHGLRLVGG